MKCPLKKAWSNFLATLLCLAGAVQAQTPAISVKPPTVTPPPPTAQAFMRYGEIPVDPSTGVPSISIPIYTLGGKNMTVPISLSYHASGIKVNDVASEVGLGWVLNAGGLIARTVNGRPDEKKSPIRTFANATQLMNQIQADVNVWDGSCSCMQGIMNREDFLNGNFVDAEDYMSDRYFYKLPNGTSGVFTYDYSTMADDETSLVTLPYRPYRIEKFLSGPSNTTSRQIDSLRITDDNGIRYSFAYYSSLNPISDWILTRMVSADGTDIIKFKYIIQNVNNSAQTKSFTYYGPDKVSGPYSSCFPYNPGSSFSSSLSAIPNNTPILDQIVSAEAIVKFTYANRDDFPMLQRLSTITIAPVASPTSIVKSIQLNHSYFGSTPADKRLRLNNVSVSAPGVAQPQVHTFTYESQTLPPYPEKMERYPPYPIPTYSEDFWGYYNGANSKSLIPAEFIPLLSNSGPSGNPYADQQYYGGNRHAGSVANACMLKEISYPTGGRTVFVFERPFGTIVPYGGIAGGEFYGGFRVSSITNYDGITGVPTVKTYEYSGEVSRPIRKEDFWYDQRSREQGSEIRGGGCWPLVIREMVFSNPLLPLEVAPGMPVMYTSVTEYNGTKAGNAGKTEYVYNMPYSPSDYYSWDHPSQYEMPFHYHPYHRDKGNYSPELISKTEYAFDGTTYRPVSRVTNTYTQLYTQEFLTGIKLSRPERYQLPTYFVFPGCTYLGRLNCNLYSVQHDYIESVVALDTKAYQESSLLTKTERYAFDQLDPSKYVLTTTDYTYNEPNLAVREQSTRTSTGEVFKTTYKYPHDFATQAPYNHMVTAKHLWSPVIETSTYKNSTSTIPLESTKMRYDFWNGSTDQVYPAEVSVKPYNASAYESRVQYLGYDLKGNVLSVSKAGDVPTSYVWGYNGQHPIAEARNAAPAAIAYTSFEWSSPGGWAYTPGNNNVNLVASAARTGRISYRLNGSGGVRRDNLPAGDYELLFWAQAATRPAVNHNGTLLADQQVAQAPGGWYQYRLRLRLGNWGFVNLDASAGTAMLLDEVRLHPVGAQLTSYTYEPLVGMTSQAAPNGRLTTYEYDELGRLVRTRDEQGRILGQQQYHYAGQP